MLLHQLPGRFDRLALSNLADTIAQPRDRLPAHGIVLVPHVQAERHSAGDHIADVRMHFDLPDRGDQAIYALGTRLDQLRADACLRRAMGAAARRLAEDFPWAGYGQRLLEAYQQMTTAV